MSEGPLDYEQVMRDAVVVETLACRGDLSEVDDEELVRLLARWAADVDVPASRPVRTGGPVPTRTGRWRHGGIVALTVAAVAVGSGGAAAAAGADPVAPLRAAVALVTGSGDGPDRPEPAAPSSTPSAPSPSHGATRLPTQAATSAQVAASLRRASAMVARGDLVGAQVLLAAAQEQLAAVGDQAAPGLAHRLAALAAQLDRATQSGSPDGSAQPGRPDGSAQPGTGKGQGHQPKPGTGTLDDAGSPSTVNLGHGAGGSQGADAHGKASSRP